MHCLKIMTCYNLLMLLFVAPVGVPSFSCFSAFLLPFVTPVSILLAFFLSPLVLSGLPVALLGTVYFPFGILSPFFVLFLFCFLSSFSRFFSDFLLFFPFFFVFLLRFATLQKWPRKTVTNSSYFWFDFTCLFVTFCFLLGTCCSACCRVEVRSKSHPIL